MRTLSSNLRLRSAGILAASPASHAMIAKSACSVRATFGWRTFTATGCTAP